MLPLTPSVLNVNETKCGTAHVAELADAAEPAGDRLVGEHSGCVVNVRSTGAGSNPAVRGAAAPSCAHEKLAAAAAALHDASVELDAAGCQVAASDAYRAAIAASA